MLANQPPTMIAPAEKRAAKTKKKSRRASRPAHALSARRSSITANRIINMLTMRSNGQATSNGSTWIVSAVKMVGMGRQNGTGVLRIIATIWPMLWCASPKMTSALVSSQTSAMKRRDIAAIQRRTTA